jgi:sulfur carrier protein ThiS
MSGIPTSDPDHDENEPGHARRQPVEVSLEITNEEGESETSTLTIDSGPTAVTVLKDELGIAEDASLWVIEKNGKKKPLGDHETHNVKEGDRYQALVRGGVS